MKIVTVVPLEKGIWRTDLTYFTAKEIKSGSIVSVPVRNKKILGLVTDVKEAVFAKADIKDMSFQLKKITEVKDHSIFRREFLESVFAVGSYFVAKRNYAITSLIPAVFMEKYDKMAEFSNAKHLNKEINKNPDEVKNIRTEKLLFQADTTDRVSFYKTLIRGYFAKKKSVFIVLPTEYDIEAFRQVLSKGIENFTFVVHGGLKPKKIIETCEEIMNSQHGVLVIGTAQFLSIPRMDIEVIIVERENSAAFKMIPKPHIDLRVFAELFASRIGAKFILGDTLLRFETASRADTEGLGEVHPLSFRINLSETKMEIINPKENISGNLTYKFKILADKTFAEIQSNLDVGKNVFLFSLRKGLATYTVCRDCGETVHCDKCLAPLVLYLSRAEKRRMFACNRCNTEKSAETACERCGSWNLMPLGIGSDTVFEEVRNKFPKNKVFKLDSESAKSKKEAEKIIKEFFNPEKEKNGKILVGTEMVFFYLKENIDLMVVAAFDGLWTIPHYKINEKVIRLLLLILEKTGRKLIIQTRNEKDPTLLALQSENLLPFVREELEDRKNLDYPPYKRFIKITFLGDKAQSLQAKDTLKKVFSKYDPEIFSGFISKNKDQYATNALIKIEPQNWSLPELCTGSSMDENLKNLLFSLPDSFEIFVDPEDLL